MDLYCIKEEEHSFDESFQRMIFVGSYDTVLEMWEYLWDTILLCAVLGAKEPYLWQPKNERPSMRVQCPWFGFEGTPRDYTVGKLTVDNFSLNGVEVGIELPTWDHIIFPLLDEFATEYAKSVVRHGYNRHLALRVGEYLRVKYGFLKREVQHSTEDVNNYLRTMTII